MDAGGGASLGEASFIDGGSEDWDVRAEGRVDEKIEAEASRDCAEIEVELSESLAPSCFAAGAFF